MSQSIPYSKPIAIVDVETTGGSAANNRLIEIGIIRIENGVEVRRFQSLVQPGQSVPIFVQNLTGISDHALESAPVFRDIADEVEECLKDALFIGHNVRFDYDFVRHEFRRLERRFVAPTLCSARLSRALFPEHKRHNLSELVERHGLSVSSRHRALDDAQAVWDFFRKTIETIGTAKFGDVFEKLVAGRPPQTMIPASRFQNIPESAGAYIFRDAHGAALYVGKSANLRERILGHFYGDFENPKEAQLLEQATDLEWIPAPGELSALFLEAELVQKLNPLHARKARKSMGMICAMKRVNADGYPQAELVRESDVQNKNDVLAYYRGFREAKEALALLADKFKLCRKLLGLEKEGGACSGVQFKRCSGACLGAESAEVYSAKFARAFQQAGTASWPYPSAILVDEFDEELNQGEAYVVQNWLLLARIRYQGESRQVEKLTSGFDWDQLKILKRVIQSETARIRSLEKQEMQSLLSGAAIKK